MEKQLLKTLENIKFKKTLEKIRIECIEQHPYHLKTYNVVSEGYYSKSMSITGDEPINPIILIYKDLKYQLISGAGRLDHMIKKNLVECECFVIGGDDITDSQVEDLVIGLNKQRIKEGNELRKEFQHFMEKYPSKKGVKGYNRYREISQEVNECSEWVRKMIFCIEKFQNTFLIKYVDLVFAKKLSLKRLRELCGYITKNSVPPEHLIDKMIEHRCEFISLKDIGGNIDLVGEMEIDLMLPHLQNSEQQELEKAVKQLGKTKGYIKDFKEGKSQVKILSPEYISNNSLIKNGDSGKTVLPKKYIGKIRCMVGSPEYGYNTKRPGRNWSDNHEELSEMTSKDFAEYTAKIYEKYLIYLTPDGSIYVIVYDYKDKDGSYSCFPEHLALEMKNIGLHLTGRKKWVKTNPLRRQYSYKDSVEGYEYIYRFSLSPNHFFLNPFMFMKEETETIIKATSGCTNHSNNETGVKGGKYFQSNLKKILNVLDENYCEDIIKCNVGNPGDFFRQSKEKKHSSTSPISLTATLILESTQPGDIVLDIWNGVGNTMLSSLLLGRKYVGIEIEQNYYEQTIEKVDEVEKFVKNYDILNLNNKLKDIA